MSEQVETLKDTESEKIERFEAEKDKKHDYKECIKCHKLGYGLKDYSEYNKTGLISLYQVHPYTLRVTNKITGEVRTEYGETRCYIGQGRPLTDMDRGITEGERQIVSKLTNQLSEIERVEPKLLYQDKIISKEYEDRLKARRNPILVICPTCKREGRFTYANKKANRYMIRHPGNERHYLPGDQADHILKGLGRGKETLDNIRLTPPQLEIPKKRGRGRPRKSESVSTPTPIQSQLEIPKKRGRGRPRKSSIKVEQKLESSIEGRLEKWSNDCNPDRTGLPELALCKHDKPSRWRLRFAPHNKKDCIAWLRLHSEEPPINITYFHSDRTGECSIRLDRKQPLESQLTPPQVK
jgi:hypothetical protein